MLVSIVAQISYASTSVTLSGRANLFRTVPSDESLPPALATVMQYYGWRHVAIVTEREPQFLQFLPILNGYLLQAGMAIDYFIVGMSTAETIFVSLHCNISLCMANNDTSMVNA